MMQNNNPNGQKPPPESLHFERNPVICQQCHKPFDDHLLLEVIEDLSQIRIGNGLITEIKVTCLFCGSTYRWTLHEKILEKYARNTGEIMKKIGIYKPE